MKTKSFSIIFLMEKLNQFAIGQPIMLIHCWINFLQIKNYILKGGGGEISFFPSCVAPTHVTTKMSEKLKNF
jgi:hypothetical protein